MHIVPTFVLSLTLAGSCLASQADALQIRSMAASCAGCHGTNGVAQPGMESLAGKPKDDLLTKMQDFKSGKRVGTIMKKHAVGYTDAEIEAMGAYFASLK